MPASLETNRRVIQELREGYSAHSPLFFPVSIRPLNSTLVDAYKGDDAQGHNSQWQLLQRDDTNEVLAVHKDQYRLVTNRTIIDQLEEALINSQLDLTGLRVTDAVTHNGGRGIRTYKFPAHRVDIGDGDAVEMLMKVQNSYDASRCLKIIIGAFRILCENGLVIGESLYETKLKHVASLDLATVAARLSESIEIFDRSGQQWVQWRQTPCPQGVPESVVQSIPSVSEAMQERIMEIYRTNSRNEGQNLWTLFNAMTAWSSHDRIQEKAQCNTASIVMAREDKVRRALEHPIFRMAA